ncbi:MAG TPA: nitroreductase family deazaflavin-dependent oxidoreductase [Ktedonobacterales bacterium]|jgi:deazaflavin-dependent oxidoreductase (nitroreductase family)|nr:nitroreductase family deazaflavin-dependent oxidoreductase [Ktedonobacterales bacterium]
MATTAATVHLPAFVRLGNLVMTTLLRAGVRVTGPNRVPTYLLTVRGRKSGQPRTTPIVTIEQDGKRYFLTPFGVVDWVRNLRAAGEATLTRGRRVEKIQATELSSEEGSLVLKRGLEERNIPSFLVKYFGMSATSSEEELRETAAQHPVFLLQSIA